jgi:asparagine synthase (glutamine-hydrolysing)
VGAAPGVRKELPRDIINRPKHGFNVPIDHWLQNEWCDLFEETFAESSP